MSKLAERLAKRIYAESGLIFEPKINRTRCGYWQKAQGAWSWWMQTKDYFQVGSRHSATACVTAKKISINREAFSQSDYTIDILDPLTLPVNK